MSLVHNERTGLAVVHLNTAGRRAIAARLGAAVIVIGAISLAVLPVIGSLVEWSTSATRKPDQTVPMPDGIIVLGGGLRLYLQYPELNPSQAPNTRLAKAVQLAKEYPKTIILYSGREDAPGPMPALLRAGIAHPRIIWEDRSDSTAENATFAAQLMHPRPTDTWLLVTDDWHMPRAERCFQRAGFNVVPEPVHQSSSARRTIWQSYHEGLGRIAYSIFNLCKPF